MDKAVAWDQCQRSYERGRRAGIEAAAQWLFDQKAGLFPLKIADAIAAIRALADKPAPDALLPGLERARKVLVERFGEDNRAWALDAEIAARKGG